MTPEQQKAAYAQIERVLVQTSNHAYEQAAKVVEWHAAHIPRAPLKTVATGDTLVEGGGKGMNFDRNIVSEPPTRMGEAMRAGIEVESREEAELIRMGLADPATRALVKVMGALSTLPSDRARKRVMTCVVDYFEEQAESGGSPLNLT